MTTQRLTGRVALVSGGGRGIGRAISARLAADGAALAVNYRRDDAAANETVEAIVAEGGRAKAYAASIDDFEACRGMVASIAADLGPVGILVNNGGIASRGNSVADTDIAEWERVLRTNLYGAFHLCQLVLPGMRAQERGDVVMVSSIATRWHGANGSPYNVAKAGVEELAFTLAHEERPNGVRVNVVAPGIVVTEMGDRLARAIADVGSATDLDARSPFGRVCRPEDVAGVVAFLVSRDGSYVSGQRIYVDGDAPQIGS